MTLDDLMQQALREAGCVGAAAAIVRGDDVTIATAGTADGTRPIIDETPFQIASITKPMIATVLAGLAERGQLSFDDSVTLHVPELAGTQWAKGVTIRHLMSCTGGIPLTEHREFLFDADDEDALSLYARAMADEQDVIHEPGRAWCYSNAGWSLLGRAIETITGLEWEQAMQQELLQPLGMESTTFRSFDPASFAHGFLDDGDEHRPMPAWHRRAIGPGGASIWSTIGDLARFAQMHLGTGQERTVSDEALSSLRVTHAEVGMPLWADGWGLGFARFDYEGATAWGWDGIGAGHRAILRLLPDQNAAIVLLVNSTNGRKLYRELFPRVLQQEFGVIMPPVDLNPREDEVPHLARYVGAYAWPDRKFEVSLEDEGLVLDNGIARERLRAINPTTFLRGEGQGESPVLHVGQLDADGHPHMLYSAVWGFPRRDRS